MDIRHEEASRRFIAVVEGRECAVHYRVEEEGVWTVLRTYVPEELRGRNLAGELTVFVLETARRAGIRIRPQCGYTKVYCERHPEYAEILV